MIALLSISCKSKKKIITKKNTKKNEVITTPEKKVDVIFSKNKSDEKERAIRLPATTNDYILLYKNIAMTEMQLYKIPASITLAQGILESGSGKGRLAVKANNKVAISKRLFVLDLFIILPSKCWICATT